TTLTTPPGSQRRRGAHAGLSRDGASPSEGVVGGRVHGGRASFGRLPGCGCCNSPRVAGHVDPLRAYAVCVTRICAGHGRFGSASGGSPVGDPNAAERGIAGVWTVRACLCVVRRAPGP